jgi:hypothetical protein
MARRPYTWPAGQPSRPSPTSGITDLLHRPALTRVWNSFQKYTKPWATGQACGADQPHFGSVGPGLCALSSPHVILSMTLSYFRHNEDMRGFWSIWCFSIIWCSWNDKSMKLVELVSNKHLSSISWMEFGCVGSRYVYFMTANTPPHTHLEFCSSQSKIKELNHRGNSKNSRAIIARE